jgi:aquaporin Z
MKSYIAELIGTCLFTLVLILAAGSGAWVVTIFAVFTLTMLSYVIGHVSGAHVNPAITLGAIMTTRIKPLRGLYYIIAQLAGAALAILFSKWIGLGITAVPHSAIDWRLFSAELVGTLIFGFGVASVLFKRTEPGPAGFIVGISLFAGIIVSSLMLGAEAAQGAVLNPAIAFGLNLMTVEALIAPLLGSIIGMWLFVLISEDISGIWRGVANMFGKKEKGAENGYIPHSDKVPQTGELPVASATTSAGFSSVTGASEVNSGHHGGMGGHGDHGHTA